MAEPGALAVRPWTPTSGWPLCEYSYGTCDEPPLVETEPCSETTGLYTKPELKPTERLPVRTFTEAEDQFRRPGAFLSRLPPINGIGRPTGQKISKKIRRS